jgi:plasmid stabilization system protein ParE
MAKVVLTAGAEIEYEAALRWYADIGLKVALRFQKAFQELLDFVGRFPEASGLCDQIYRYRSLKKFSCGIVYRIESGNVVVGGVPHHSNLPKDWTRC